MLLTMDIFCHAAHDGHMANLEFHSNPGLTMGNPQGFRYHRLLKSFGWTHEEWKLGAGDSHHVEGRREALDDSQIPKGVPHEHFALVQVFVFNVFSEWRKENRERLLSIFWFFVCLRISLIPIRRTFNSIARDTPAPAHLVHRSGLTVATNKTDCSSSFCFPQSSRVVRIYHIHRHNLYVSMVGTDSTGTERK